MVTIEKIRWHRNGIGGCSFRSVEFTDTDAEAKLVAILPSQEDDGREDYRAHGACFVITPGDMGEHWRGDWYERKLRAALLEADIKEFGWSQEDIAEYTIS